MEYGELEGWFASHCFVDIDYPSGKWPRMIGKSAPTAEFGWAYGQEGPADNQTCGTCKNRPQGEQIRGNAEEARN
ncbi:protein of unknown function [Candidatus Filomicrobium marinum]|uniref:Uncharacterized protein n=1 Tax=Candidatus Filomicrobium marinum TaxID=1608628 RepID=A0A0D6J9X7_9HYPH|nr:protein of unknown function [Candidatus Filomicrobium marinum]CPR15126.1 protein of unknown function [Candidatus Filomicrobium marinum]